MHWVAETFRTADASGTSCKSKVQPPFPLTLSRLNYVYSSHRHDNGNLARCLYRHTVEMYCTSSEETEVDMGDGYVISLIRIEGLSQSSVFTDDENDVHAAG